MQFYKNKIYAFRVIIDLIALLLIFLACVLYYKDFQFDRLTLKDLFLSVYIGLVWTFTTRTNNLYEDSRSKKAFVAEIFKTLVAISVQFVAIVFLLFFMDYTLFNERFVILYISCLVVGLPIVKYLMRIFVLFLRKNGFNIRNVVILGSDKAAIRFYNLINNNPNFGYQVIGFLSDEPIQIEGVRVLGGTKELDKVVDTYKVQEVIVAIPKIDFSEIEKIIRIVNNAGVRVRVIPDFYHLFYNRYVVKNFGDIPMISLRKEPLEEPHWRFVKRAFDIFFSAFVLIFICSWLFPILALIIKLDSKGPVFFKQKRMGKNKKDFNCYKFRSMTVNSNSDLVQASKNDARITKVGRFIRKTSLDEFPQFFNVLRGEMSIVGPRPHMTKHNEEYSKIIEHYMVRQLVKPGITGWAQVNGYRGETKEDIDMLNRVEYDVWYLENWYFMLDIKIVFMTVWNVFKGEEKAY